MIQQTKDYILTKYKLVHFFFYHINVLSLLNGNYKILFLKNNFIKLNILLQVIFIATEYLIDK